MQACTQSYALHNMATLFNNHLYTSSSGTLVGAKFTATYVGIVDGVHITVCVALQLFLRTLSASAFMH